LSGGSRAPVVGHEVQWEDVEQPARSANLDSGADDLVGTVSILKMLLSAQGADGLDLVGKHRPRRQLVHRPAPRHDRGEDTEDVREAATFPSQVLHRLGNEIEDLRELRLGHTPSDEATGRLLGPCADLVTVNGRGAEAEAAFEMGEDDSSAGLLIDAGVGIHDGLEGAKPTGQDDDRCRRRTQSEEGLEGARDGVARGRRAGIGVEKEFEDIVRGAGEVGTLQPRKAEDDGKERGQ
jgi:hypothetical protein